MQMHLCLPKSQHMHFPHHFPQVSRSACRWRCSPLLFFASLYLVSDCCPEWRLSVKGAHLPPLDGGGRWMDGATCHLFIMCSTLTYSPDAFSHFFLTGVDTGSEAAPPAQAEFQRLDKNKDCRLDYDEWAPSAWSKLLAPLVAAAKGQPVSKFSKWSSFSKLDQGTNKALIPVMAALYLAKIGSNETMESLSKKNLTNAQIKEMTMSPVQFR